MAKERYTETIDGVQYTYPSTTEIIGDQDGTSKKPLMRWAAKLERDFWIGSDIKVVPSTFAYERDRSADWGTECHNMAERYWRGEDVGVPSCPEVMYGYNAFLGWVKQYNVICFEPELKLVDRENHHTGTMDLPCMIDQPGGANTFVVDMKLGGVYPSHRWQLADYRHMANRKCYDTDKFDIPLLNKCAVLQLPKKAGVDAKLVVSANPDIDYRIFKHKQDAYMLQHPIIAKKAMEGKKL